MVLNEKRKRLTSHFTQKKDKKDKKQTNKHENRHKNLQVVTIFLFGVILPKLQYHNGVINTNTSSKDSALPFLERSGN